ncbi:type II secretion system protein [Massilia sp. LXY-6]|uniref:type II secretion system protein n=1 Tax=Massilia sp. LXY-6 TaxID=3379823 RepID=UPI003EDE7CA4
MVARRRPAARRRRDGGFTYVGLIVLVTIIGLVGAATLKADALLRRAAAEQELLEIGAAFSAALTSYAEATPRGQPPQPPSLEELLKDPRVPGIRRHLRKIFVDPVTGKAEWGIVWLNKGNGIKGSGGSGVVAVYSLSGSKPLKQANFDARFQNFENREHLSEWKFGVTGQGVAQGQPGQPGQPGAGQPVRNPAEPQPSLFPERGNPGTLKPSPAEPPSPPPEPAPQEAPPSEASGDGDKDGKDEKGEKDSGTDGDGEARDGKRR